MTTVEREQVLAFRAGRQALAKRSALTLADAASFPASDFQRGSALLALAARSDRVTADEFDRATDSGELVVAPSLRAAIHALAPADFALYGRALIADGDEELGAQLGRQVRRELGEAGIPPRAALEEVAEATGEALAGGALSKDELHEELRGRVRAELLPWCKGCRSHHVAPMLWRFAGVQAGMRCDSERCFGLGEPGAPPETAEVARRFLRFYGPASSRDLEAWTGVGRAQGRRIWDQIAGELTEVDLDGRTVSLLREDEEALASPPRAAGVRLLPPRDPYLQQPDRATLAPDPQLRKRLFRPVASPGAVLADGRLAGLWRGRKKGKRLEVEVESVGAIDRDDLEGEASRVAELRGAEAAVVTARPS